MKQLLPIQPVFTPGGPGVGTLDFSQLPNFQANRLYAVINLTRNVTIYVPGTSAYGASNIVNSVITLAYDTSLHSTTDDLSVFYDTDPGGIYSNYVLENNGNLQKVLETNKLMLTELMVMNYALSTGLNIKQDDIEAIRSDILSNINGNRTSIE